VRIFGFEISRAKAPAEKGRGQLEREGSAQGPYTTLFSSWMARKVMPSLYEALRESIPVVDTGIHKLCTFDGIVRVEGDNAGLVAEIEDWMNTVQVNDMQTGFQAFVNNFTNETYEQGFSISEYVMNRERTDIVRLNVADSKDIRFRRGEKGVLETWYKGQSHSSRALNATEQVGSILHETLSNPAVSLSSAGWKKLKPEKLLYYSIGNENHNPYGVSVMRSIEFVAKMLLTIENSQLNSWERFGDPSYQITYKCGKKELGEATLEARRASLATDFNAMISAKRSGKSADFVHAIDKDSDIKISVIGADGQVLEMEIPARHALEQITSRIGLPPWVYGFNWSTTERLAKHQAEVMLQEAETRGKGKLPGLTALVSTMLRLRGRTWKPGDWSLGFDRPNLHDLVAQAQARFLNAQADMYDAQNGGAPTAKQDKPPAQRASHSHNGKSCARSQTKESRPINSPELDGVEADFRARLTTTWNTFAGQVLALLGLASPDSSSSPVQPPLTGKAPGDPVIPSFSPFTFSAEQRAQIMDAMNNWIGEWEPDKGGEESLKFYYGQAYSIGLIQAASLVGADRPVLDIITNSNIFDDLVLNGFQLVKDGATRIIVNQILPEMEAQMLAGANPLHVANRLSGIFGDSNSNWERLARSETSMAAERAKKAEARAEGIAKMEFLVAPDACPICQALAGVYPIDKVPLPVADTHPRCYCATVPVVN